MQQERKRKNQKLRNQAQRLRSFHITRTYCAQLPINVT